jgi:hypothetical protein
MSGYTSVPIVGDIVTWEVYYAQYGTYSMSSGKVVKCDDDGVLVSVGGDGRDPCFQRVPYTKIIDVRTSKVKP